MTPNYTAPRATENIPANPAQRAPENWQTGRLARRPRGPRAARVPGQWPWAPSAPSAGRRRHPIRKGTSTTHRIRRPRHWCDGSVRGRTCIPRERRRLVLFSWIHCAGLRRSVRDGKGSGGGEKCTLSRDGVGHTQSAVAAAQRGSFRDRWANASDVWERARYGVLSPILMMTAFTCMAYLRGIRRRSRTRSRTWTASFRWCKFNGQAEEAERRALVWHTLVGLCVDSRTVTVRDSKSKWQLRLYFARVGSAVGFHMRHLCSR